MSVEISLSLIYALKSPACLQLKYSQIKFDQLATTSLMQ